MFGGALYLHIVLCFRWKMRFDSDASHSLGCPACRTQRSCTISEGVFLRSSVMDCSISQCVCDDLWEWVLGKASQPRFAGATKSFPEFCAIAFMSFRNSSLVLRIASGCCNFPMVLAKGSFALPSIPNWGEENCGSSPCVEPQCCMCVK